MQQILLNLAFRQFTLSHVICKPIQFGMLIVFFFKEREKIQNIHLYQLCELQQTDNIFCAVELTALFISSSLNLEWLI